MVEVKIEPDLIAEGYCKLQHACEHDQQMETVADYLNEADEISEIYQDIRGTRKVIFSLLLDLKLI